MSGGLGDILSLALEQTGVGVLPTPHVAVEDPTSILSAAAGTIDNSVLSSDIGALTEGLFSSLHGTKEPASMVASYEAMPPQMMKGNGHNIAGNGFTGSFPAAMECGHDVNPCSTGGNHSELCDIDLKDLDDLLCDPGSNAGTVPHQNPGVSVPNALGSIPFQSSNQNSAFNTKSSTTLPIYDELSELLNDTGTEYLESITQQLDSTDSHSQIPIPATTLPVPVSSYPTTFSTPFTRELINPAASFPNAAAIITSSSGGSHSAVRFSVDSVIDQLSQPSQSIQLDSSRPFTFSGKTGPPPVVVPLVAKPATALSNGRESMLVNSRAQSVVTPAETKQQVAGEDSDEEDEQYTAADTYTNYKPAKLKLGFVHPDPVVESSSLSSVEPPQVWFDLKLPSHVIEEAWLSSLQLESVVYACQQHMNILSDGTRAGFLIGDGAGVGKGRTVAGVIYQNYLEGRKKALWLSVSNDLKFDAIRDLRDVGAKKIDVYSLNKFHYGKISGKRNGRVRKGVIFATYSSLIGESSSGGKYRTRFNQLLHWLGPHFEGVIVLDECHKAKNLVPTGSSKPSKTGLTVLQLQKKLPKARIVYCSATGASEPRNMAYMSRLGIWGMGTQFPTFQDFIKAVERRGVGAMEIVAMDMKLRGMYTARQLSFAGVKFSINEVPLSADFVDMYNASVKLWVEARKLFQEASDLMDFDRKKLKPMWSQFWAAHQRFFKYLCIAAKVPEAIKLAQQALSDGKCVVIGLQSTGEARTLEQLGQNDGELTGFISTAKGVLETLIRRHFPTPSSGIDWTLFENDPTLPDNCRKRKRGGGRRGPLFREDESFSSESEDTSGTPEGSDSAVESSSEGSEGSSTSSDEEETGGESNEEERGDFNPFGAGDEPWLKRDKPKTKRHKANPRETSKRNFSIKPPPSSSGRKGCKTKTGFNSKSLKFEPVNSPNEPRKTPPHLLERRQSVCLAEGIRGSPNSSLLDRKPSLQLSMSAVGDGKSLLDLMSSSAMASGSQSGLRNVAVRKMKEELLQKLEVLSPHLPTNTLDELIDGLGGPERVAEMTGRRGRVVSLSDGSIQYQLRSESDISLELLNITEKKRFMDGKKNIAIISEAASSGISLQSDRRVKNHKRRVHITLELPWSADKAIQQFGRTHRSNQVNAPEYVFLISELSGEQRFASIVAKRLESLGALTHGDRRATESKDLSKYNVDTKYGRQSLEVVLKSVLGSEAALVKSQEYPPEFFDECRTFLIGVGILTKDERGLLALEKEATSISRFLNRILGLPVKLQNQLFAYFSDTLSYIIQQARRMGRWDSGILDFGASGEHVDIVEMEEFVGDPAFGTATTQLYTIHVERGMSFSEAVQKLHEDHHPGEGFYVSKRVRNGKQVAELLKVSEPSSNLFSVYRPNTGRQAKPEKLSILQKKYTKVEPAEAEKWWSLQYESSESVCTHAFWQGKCRLSVVGRPCEIGLRRRTYHILGGSVLGVWTHLEGVFVRHSGHNSRMQIARVRMPSKRLVGILIPTMCVEDMRQTLARIALQAAGTSENPLEV